MPVFNFAGLGYKRPAGSGGGDSVGILKDRLTILDNMLAQDGVISQGDYDMLIEAARSVRNNPTLTPSQRSDLDVKISQYEKGKSTTRLNRDENIERIMRGIENDKVNITRNLGNNPTEYVQGRMESIKIAMSELAEAASRRAEVGDDPSAHVNEYNLLAKEYAGYADTLNVVSSYQGGEPIQGLRAYVTTSPVTGEITSIEYGPSDGRGGFVDTNAYVNGIQIAGKPNGSQGNEPTFRLGNSRYIGAQIIQDPNTGQWRAGTMINESQHGAFVQGASITPENFAPEQLPIQGTIPRDSWAVSRSGTMYYRKGDGTYRKHVNPIEGAERPTKEEMYPLTDDDARMIGMQSGETVDETARLGEYQNLSMSMMMLPFGGPPPSPIGQGQPPGGQTYGPALPEGFTPATPQASQPVSQSAPTARTKSPVERASSAIGATAQRTMSSARNFLGSMIG